VVEFGGKKKNKKSISTVLVRFLLLRHKHEINNLAGGKIYFWIMVSEI
jgi:hypothetical protein